MRWLDDVIPMSIQQPILRNHNNSLLCEQTGEVCISILHEGSDPSSGEEDSERWNPTQGVR